MGADFCVPMLREARRKGFGLVVAGDGLALPFADGSFDAVTVAFGLRNMASWPDALREMARVLKPGGHLLVLDFSIPRPPLRGPYRFYLHRILPWFAALVTGRQSAYEYLGESIEKFPHGAEMTRLFEANGFSGADCRPLSGGIVSLYTGCRKS